MQQTSLSIPAFTAYSEPNPEGIPLSGEKGIFDWTDAKQQVAWYGYLGAGSLQMALQMSLPENTQTQFRWTVTRIKDANTHQKVGQGTVTIANIATSNVAPLGSLNLPRAGYYRIGLEGLARTGTSFGAITSLELAGNALKAAQFNLLERRNAASVHLGYPIPTDTRVVAFYNEITVRTEPLYSYYMACGFRRGYFGIQVNSPTERRVIFSIWDAGNEAISRDKVPEADQVKLLTKGEKVIASGFGNEGTGGHSHLVYPWKRDVLYRFLVTAEPKPPYTIYSAYFWFPEKKGEKKKWGIIASFRAPKDGNTLFGLYSFNENFGGDNGQLQRLAEFGPQWVLSDKGVWTELTTARFTHDATGKKDRLDYAMGVTKNGFYLSNGGFSANGIKLGDTRTRVASKKRPEALSTEALSGIT